MSKVKIRFGGVSETSMARKIEDAGFGMTRNEKGEICAEVKFPGVDSVLLSFENMCQIRDVICADRNTGTSPGDVFVRTAVEDSEGNLSARFSDERGARSVSFTDQDRKDVGELFAKIFGWWGEAEDNFEAAERAAVERDVAAASEE